MAGNNDSEFLSLIKLLNDADYTGYSESVLPTVAHAVSDHKDIYELIFTISDPGFNQVGSYNINEHGLLNVTIAGNKHQAPFNLVKISLTTLGGIYYLSLGYSSTTFPPSIVPGNVYNDVTYSPKMGGGSVIAGLQQSPGLSNPFDKELIQVLTDKIAELEMKWGKGGCCYKCQIVPC